MDINQCLADMKTEYDANPTKAVRSQSFIRILHDFLAGELQERLSPWAIRQGISVEEEVELLGSHKPKKADIAILHPTNGPLMILGVRSQMSSVGKNALTYYQDIIGECISLQDRFPMAVYGYAYLHPLRDPKITASVDHKRYALMYQAISGRSGHNFKDVKGVYDQFAYLVADFSTTSPELRDDLIAPILHSDISITTFTDRLVETFKARNLWLDIFK